MAVYVRDQNMSDNSESAFYNDLNDYSGPLYLLNVASFKGGRNTKSKGRPKAPTNSQLFDDTSIGQGSYGYPQGTILVNFNKFNKLALTGFSCLFYRL